MYSNMVDLKEYDEALTQENTAKNFASVVLLLLSLLSFLAFLFIQSPIGFIEVSALRILFIVFTVIFFLIAMSTKFIKIGKDDSEF